MRKLALTLSALTLAASLTGCAGPLTEPAPVASSSLTRTAADTVTEEYAWTLYEQGGGSARIKVDPTRGYRVTFMSATTVYPHWAGPNDAVVPGKDGRWYWFKVDQP